MSRFRHLISAAGFPAYLHGFSAIDSYLGRSGSAAVHVLCGADISDLARLFEDIRYPGAAFADAAVDFEEATVYFRCEDADDLLQCRRSSFQFLEFFQDCKTGRFFDPNNLYPLLREIRDSSGAQDSVAQWREWLDTKADFRRAAPDAALIIARYFPDTSSRTINEIAKMCNNFEGAPPLCAEEQRQLLTGLLETANPAPGLELLKNAGYIGAYWSELAAMDDVDHSKEFHPEGNVWKHTMETLRYRKTGGRKPSSPSSGFDIRLSLGLLLHDAGKPLSQSAGSRRFDGHAELGERQARRFLERLEFDRSLVTDVCYLVRNHMLPAALPRLPLARTGKIMASPLFPTLMELYRCDESSSFKGLDGYYQSSAAYQAYLKNRRNPYRSADGKKLKREEIKRF